MRPTCRLIGIGLPLSAALAILVSGCGNNTTTDGATPVPDMSVTNDLTTPSTPDMVMSPDMTTFSGTVLLADVQGTIMVGGDPVAVNFLQPLATFGPSAMHDIDTRNALQLGCFSDYYDLAGAGKKPTPDSDDGVVVFTNYTGGMLLTPNGPVPAPSEIDCKIDATTMAYKCGYGPITNGMLGPNPNSSPFVPGTDPLTAGMAIKITSTGGTILGTFDTDTSAKKPTPTTKLAVTENLNTIKYSPTADSTIHFTCPDDAAGCGLTAVLVTLIGSSKPPTDAAYPGAAYSVAACAGLAGQGSITIPKAVIADLVGTTAGAINFFTTRVSRGNLPDSTFKDSNGNSITAVVTRGAFGIGTYP